MPLPDDEPDPVDELFIEPLPLLEFMDEPPVFPECILPLPDFDELPIWPPCDPVPVEPPCVEAPFELPLVDWAIEAEAMPIQRAMQNTITFFIMRCCLG